MVSKETGFKGLLTPIWQEVSSLWSGAEFAFLDQSPFAEGDEAPSAAFHEMPSMSNQSAMDATQYGHC